MSQQLINRSPDLKRLRDEGFDVRVVKGYLLVGQVPYVNARQEVKFGTLVSTLTLAADKTTIPDYHVAHFIGDYPCDQHGVILSKIQLGSNPTQLAQGLVIQHSFSAKPVGGRYPDYYEKMTTYVAILSGPAKVLNPDVKAQVFPPIEADEAESVFQYQDTASSRAEIGFMTSKLELARVAIVGLGGTGAYVLDLVAKTPVKEIHLFDADKFQQHNAFRTPGAASLDDLRAQPSKVSYLASQYSKMHRHIRAHEGYIDAQSIEQLRGMMFVFLCLDDAKAKRLIVAKLEEFGVPFIDVGMGVQIVDGSLIGVLRVTTSTTQKRDHVTAKNRISSSGGDANNEYARNIQIADLNALNAALAVIKWKKLFGFYHDFEEEPHSTYTIDGNTLTNEDLLDEARHEAHA